MKIKNTTPFLVGSKVTSREPPQPEMVVVVRGTYSLTPGAPLEPIEGLDQGFLTADVFEEGDEDRSGTVLYPSDFADFKPVADVMFRGTCHAPGGDAVQECEVGFGVGDFSKTLLVIGPRPWQGPARIPFGAPGEPDPFVSQSLDYEFAYGGEGFDANPVGCGRGDATAPNVEDPDDRLSRTNRPAGPAGFGPLNSSWAPRARKVGKKYGKSYVRERAPWFSEDFDWTHFNAAPEDQQIDGYLRGDETLWFQNLHPEHAKFEVALPGLRTRVFVRDVEERFREVPMVLDTLFVDGDEGTVTLTWRGLEPVLETDLTDITSALVISEPLDAAPEPAENFSVRLAEFEAMRPGFDQLDEDVREKFEAAMQAKEEIDAAAEEAEGGKLDIAAALAPLAALLPGMEEKIDALTSLASDAASVTEGTEAPVDIPGQLAEALAPSQPIPPTGTPFAPDQVPALGLEEPLQKVVEMVEQQSAIADAEGFTIHGLDQFYEAMQNPGLALIAPNFVPPKLPGAEEEEAPETEAPAIEPKEELNDQDLRDRDFTGADLENANLSNSDLSGVSLAGANLRNARLTGAKVEGADFTGADLTRAVLIQAKAANANFEGTTLHQSSFIEADLAGATFNGMKAFQTSWVGASLDGTRLEDASFLLCDLNSAKLAGASFARSKLERTSIHEAEAAGAIFADAEIDMVSFMKANLEDASFERATGARMSFHTANLDGANFSRCAFDTALFFEASAVGANFLHANLRGARLYRTQLQNAELVEMNLFEADLSHADLGGACLDGSNLYGALFNEANLEDVDLSDVDTRHAVQMPS